MKVGLYIPCFNAEQTINSCLEAVFKQTYPVKEIVVVDDGSTDKSMEIASRYPVKIIRHTNNQGLAAARNTAVKCIDVDLIASLDSDCQPKPDWLTHLIKRIDSPNIAGAGGKLLEKHSSSIFGLWRAVHMKQYWDDEKTTPPFLFGSNTVFKRKALLEVGLYDETFISNYEDVDICERLSKAGYIFVYESNAVVSHLKFDDINSIFDNYWKWNFNYYRKKGYYSSRENFLFKIKDNLGLANRYLETDLAEKQAQLLYLDFLLALHHSLKDLEYFVTLNNPNSSSQPAISSLWLSLVDLSFFYHFDEKKSSLSTMMPKKDAFFQNFLALALVVYGIIEYKFQSEDFKRMLYKHLFLSIYKINDVKLLEVLLNLMKKHRDWESFLDKSHPNLNNSFLNEISLNFKGWLDRLAHRFPEIPRMIELSGEKTEESLRKKEVLNV